MYHVFDAIHSTQDLKVLSKGELAELAAEIRSLMLTRLSATGGHVGSNLGMIEATIALHYVFNSPQDKIVFDVSHQCYTHKLLTGRNIGGFTNPAESEHDLFSVGHASTAVSLACGLAKARDLKEEHYNVIAAAGDGAAPCNYFRAMGLDYCFVRDGHDTGALVDMFTGIRDTEHPTVVHICTEKGRGYPPARNDRENWHQPGRFDLNTGVRQTEDETETYETLTRDFLAAKMRKNLTITAITAGTPKAFGFDKTLRQEFPEQFIDVGIAEEHAVSLAAGIAKGGGKPVFGVSSTFLQRTYDQLSHDLGLNRLPAVILVFFAGIAQGSQTHMGIFDISMTASIPNILCLAPTCREEYLSMLEWGLEQRERPVIIRVPGIQTVSRDVALPSAYGQLTDYEVVEHGTTVAILALGKFFGLGAGVQKRLAAEHGIQATLINPRCYSALDEKTLRTLPTYGHRLIVTLEDGVLDGGFGEKVARFYSGTDIKTLCYGAEKEFVDNIPTAELYERYRLTEQQIMADILNELQ